MKMNSATKTITALTLLATAGFCQAEEASSKVDLKQTVQFQAAGSGNRQELNAGNVTGKGESNVKGENTVQFQAAGSANRQMMNVGNVENGGKSDVSMKQTVQFQAAGAANRQTMNIGNVKGK